jgi:hypothetical protein
MIDIDVDNIKLLPGEGIGLDEVGRSFTQSVKAAATQTFLGFTPEGNYSLAKDVANELLTKHKDLGYSPSQVTQLIRGDGYEENLDPEVRNGISKALKDRGLSIDALRADFSGRVQKAYEGDTRDDNNLGFIVGTIAGMLTPTNILGLAAGGTAKGSLAAKALYNTMAEAVIQSETALTTEQKLLNAGLAGAGTAAIGALSNALTKVVQKAGSRAPSLAAELEKMAGAPTMSPATKSALKSEATFYKAMPTSSADAMVIKEAMQADFKAGRPIRSLKVSEGPARYTRVDPFTGSETKTNFLELSPAQKAAEERLIKTGFVPEERALSPEIPVSTAPFTEIKTSTGKFSTFFDEKTGTPAVFKGSTDAERYIRALPDEVRLRNELKVAPTPEGKFAVVQASDATIIPKLPIFPDAATAKSFIPQNAVRLGLAEDIIQPIKVEGGYSLAVHANQADVLSAEKGLPVRFDGKGNKQPAILEAPAEEAYPGITAQAEKVEVQKVRPEVVTKQLDQMASSASMGDPLKKINTNVKTRKNALTEFIDCLGG